MANHHYDSPTVRDGILGFRLVIAPQFYLFYLTIGTSKKEKSNALFYWNRQRKNANYICPQTMISKLKFQ